MFNVIILMVKQLLFETPIKQMKVEVHIMNITVYDKTTGQVVANLMTATPNEVLKFIQKGYKVVDNMTRTELTESDALSMVGTADCVI